MAELRWNPLIRDYVMIASNRQARPVMQKGYCPFCPGSGKVPDQYDVLKYDNDFPALSPNPPEPEDVVGDSVIYRTAPSAGKCEVILFSPEHESSLCEFTVPHITKIVDLWAERYTAIATEDSRVKYVFIFENRGEAVGVTQAHPHGQIYGYPFIPKKVDLLLASFRAHYFEHRTCLLCNINADEVSFAKRTVYQNDDFIVYIPFFSEYPYGVYVAPKEHISHIAQFTPKQRTGLAETLKNVTGMYDALFGKKFPYMMCQYNAPTNWTSGGTENDMNQYFHFHIVFYPPWRGDNQMKWNASSETGAWAHCNPTAPEDKAEELREALSRFRTDIKDV
ncbi:galactose-1-phosphate uridylyltransferase [Clostridia bacterium]|nr:galactose-1-phosphate uridylyltransferase [Clostridia bacterium]